MRDDGSNYAYARVPAGLVWRAMRLQHPHICPVLGVVWGWPGLGSEACTSHPSPSSSPALAAPMAMPPVPVLVGMWQEFGSLWRIMDNETAGLSLRQKIGIAAGVASGLVYLHAQVRRCTEACAHSMSQ